MEELFNNQRSDDDDFYKLLGADELSSTEQINVEFKVRALDVHPDKNPDDPSAADKFAKLQRARDILTDEKKRKEYDYWRRSGLAVPYTSWIAMKDTMHTSMHWAVRQKKDLMLENQQEGAGSVDARAGKSETDACAHTVTPPSSYEYSRPSGWTSEPASDILRKFRNYQL
ncbi:dnaJ homolog subfamily C member 12-like isoform X1 [Asterias amurensis]|uniref:dnaJ homolog subfamily C member 12-like isoform X1 n=1 Tax=Asterias amurensis TaxID=7602 RepID=UPI003AB55499